MSIRTNLPVPVSATFAALAAVSMACAGSITIEMDAPSLDRWNYPFNQTQGVRTTASVFGAFTDFGFDPAFDNRDGQFHVAFDISEQVQPGLGPDAYSISSVQLTVMVANDNAFQYGDSFDPWQSYLPPSNPDYVPDVTPGRPMELFGVGFRHGFDPVTYPETAGYSPMGPFGKGHRTTFPLDAGGMGDVSNNMDSGFDPNPFAIGIADGLTPGQTVPEGTVLTFDLDVEHPAIQSYLQDAADLGTLHFMIASLFDASDEMDGAFPVLYCREHPLVVKSLASAAGLNMTVTIVNPKNPADLNGDGVVNVGDLLILLNNWGACDQGEPCTGDLNDDGIVNVGDLLVLLSAWG